MLLNKNPIATDRHMMQESVRQFNNIEKASIAVADQILSIAKSAVLEKGFCTIVMAGGRTPQHAYELLAEPPVTDEMPWQQSHFFWGDERWLASTHPDSNFSMVHNALLSKVQIPPQNIHQISTGHRNPEIGAEMYEKHLRNFFHSKSLTETVEISEQTFPSFDIVLLGMGTDGHMASLFPGSDFLEENKKWVVAVDKDEGSPPVPRVTLTLPVLNQAKNIVFLISGGPKIKILETFLNKPARNISKYPAAHVKPAGRLLWFISEKV